MKKKICLITTNHISTNPRLVKEAMALSDAGYKAHVIFTQHTAYLAKEDFKILAQNPHWTYDCLDWIHSSNTSRWVRIRSGILQKLAAHFSKYSRSLIFKKLILNRHYFFQLKVAIQAKADLYIAHNAGALAVAGDAAKKNRKQFGFDAEDFHRGEVLSCKAFKATVAIEDAYLPNAVYITAASPLIKEEYGKLYDKAKITTIRNVFPFIKQAQVVMENQALKLFWFSQTVGTNRGIQDVIKAMKVLEKNDLELHVYGHLSPAVEKIFNELIISLDFKEAPKIYFKDSVSPDELLHLATSFDIGLAIEPGFCKNNEIALSNKIFTYLVGGNAIIFSSTPAQKHFFEQYENIGFLYSPGDVDILAKHIAAYDCDRQLLNFHKKSSRELFLGELNWEEEQEILVKEVDKVIAV